MNFAIDGIPFIYNGNEIADSGRHSFFANRFYGGYYGIDWSRANDGVARRRMEVINKLVSLKRGERALYEGEVIWNEVENDDKIVSFTRAAQGERVTLFANVSKESALCRGVEGRVLIERGAKLGESLCLEPYGYVIIKES